MGRPLGQPSRPGPEASHPAALAPQGRGKAVDCQGPFPLSTGRHSWFQCIATDAFCSLLHKQEKNCSSLKEEDSISDDFGVHEPEPLVFVCWPTLGVSSNGIFK